MLNHKLQWVLSSFSAVFLPILTDIAMAQQPIDLLEPLGPNDTVQQGDGAQTFINYFNDSAEWLLSVAVGFCVIWVLVGGFQIMVAGGDQGKRDEGKSHIMWAILGLTMLLFAGFLLRTLNSMFFQ